MTAHEFDEITHTGVRQAPTEAGPRAPVDTFQPHLSMREDGDTILVEAELPGLRAADVQVHVQKDLLILEGTTPYKAPPGYQPLVEERQGSTFKSMTKLLSEVEVSGIRGTLSRGLLTLRLPKRNRPNKKRIAVQVL